MGGTKSLVDVLRVKSLATLQRVRVHREPGMALIISLGAMSRAFAPIVFDGCKVTLHVSVAKLDGRDIHGILNVIHEVSSRSFWYRYTFVPLHEHDIDGIVCLGLNHFLPIEFVTLIFGGEGLRMKNPFFYPYLTFPGDT